MISKFQLHSIGIVFKAILMHSMVPISASAKVISVDERFELVSSNDIFMNKKYWQIIDELLEEAFSNEESDSVILILNSDAYDFHDSTDKVQHYSAHIKKLVQKIESAKAQYDKELVIYIPYVCIGSYNLFMGIADQVIAGPNAKLGGIGTLRLLSGRFATEEPRWVPSPNSNLKVPPCINYSNNNEQALELWKEKLQSEVDGMEEEIYDILSARNSNFDRERLESYGGLMIDSADEAKDMGCIDQVMDMHEFAQNCKDEGLLDSDLSLCECMGRLADDLSLTDCAVSIYIFSIFGSEEAFAQHCKDKGLLNSSFNLREHVDYISSLSLKISLMLDSKVTSR